MDSGTESALPKILREYRLRHRLSQRALAEILNTEQSYISRIESGDRPSKNSDIDFLRLVSTRLVIPPEILGLSGTGRPVTENGFPPEVSEAWGSVIDLADSARNHGDPEAAIRHLRPIVAALDARSQFDRHLPKVASLLVRAKLVLGTALGDRLPPKRLDSAIHILKEANDSVCADERELRIQVLRAYGNELRKSGRVESGLESLHHARSLVPSSAINGSLAIAIARAEAQRGNWSDFQKSIADAHVALHKQTDSHPLFNPLVVYEVTLRGILSQGDLERVEKELVTPIRPPVNLAPQWRAIHLVTLTEAYLVTGEVGLGGDAAAEALAAVGDLLLPQQIRRFCSILSRHQKRSGALGDLLEGARRMLSREWTLPK